MHKIKRLTLCNFTTKYTKNSLDFFTDLSYNVLNS